MHARLLPVIWAQAVVHRPRHRRSPLSFGTTWRNSITISLHRFPTRLLCLTRVRFQAGYGLDRHLMHTPRARPGPSRCAASSAPRLAPRVPTFTAQTRTCVETGLGTWQFEGYVMYSPFPYNGTCPSGTSNVYRLYNNGQEAPPHIDTRRARGLARKIQQGGIPQGGRDCPHRHRHTGRCEEIGRGLRTATSASPAPADPRGNGRRDIIGAGADLPTVAQQVKARVPGTSGMFTRLCKDTLLPRLGIPHRHPTIVEQVYRAILDAICDGACRPASA